MRGALAALMIAGSALVLTASAASADMACRYPTGSNTCLTVEPYVYHWRVQVGIDIHMSFEPDLDFPDLVAAAQAVGQSPFVARIWGYDGASSGGGFYYITGSLLFTVPLTPTFYWEEGILYGGGSVVVSGSSFNEDTNGGDELIAEVLLQDCTEFQRFGCYPIRGFYSGFIYGSW